MKDPLDKYMQFALAGGFIGGMMLGFLVWSFLYAGVCQ